MIILLLVGVYFTLSWILRSPSFQGEISDHFKEGKFFDPQAPHTQKSFWQFLKWRFTAVPSKWEPYSIQVRQALDEVQEGELHITWVNHATVLLQTKHEAVLTDPIWAERASPFSWIGPKRFHEPGIALTALPPITAVVVSHDHYDHLNLSTLSLLAERSKDTHFVTGLGNKYWMEKAGATLASELDWWKTITVSPSLSITFVPSKHWSARFLDDRRNTLWGGFVITIGEFSVYYSGDTAFGEHFAEITKKEGPFDFCILPIGAYEPRWFMKDNHMTPGEAVTAHQVLQCPRSLGVHYGTFQLSDEGQDAPTTDLQRERKVAGISEDEFSLIPPGKTLVVKK